MGFIGSKKNRERDALISKMNTNLLEDGVKLITVYVNNGKVQHVPEKQSFFNFLGGYSADSTLAERLAMGILMFNEDNPDKITLQPPKNEEMFIFTHFYLNGEYQFSAVVDREREMERERLMYPEKHEAPFYGKYMKELLEKEHRHYDDDEYRRPYDDEMEI